MSVSETSRKYKFIIRMIGMVAAMLASAGPAAAAEEAPAESPETTRDARQISVRFADCVLRRYPELAIDVVIHSATNEQIRASHRLSRLIHQSCMGQALGSANTAGLRFSGPGFLQILADGLIRRYYAASGPTDLSAAPPVDRPPIEAVTPARLIGRSPREQEQIRQEYQAEVVRRWTDEVGECVARAQPEAVRQLSLTVPDSVQERAQFNTMLADVGACINEGMSATFPRSTLRGAMAINYFRLAYQVQPPAVVRTR